MSPGHSAAVCCGYTASSSALATMFWGGQPKEKVMVAPTIDQKNFTPEMGIVILYPEQMLRADDIVRWPIEPTTLRLGQATDEKSGSTAEPET